jgi:hypothetical protein
MGVPHPEWELIQGKIEFRACFAALIIDSVSIPISETISHMALMDNKNYLKKVAVQDDQDTLLVLWTVMFQRNIVNKAESFLNSPEYAKTAKDKNNPFNKEAYLKAKKGMLDYLINSFNSTNPTPSIFFNEGTIEEQRSEWLWAISELSGDKAGPAIKKIYDELEKKENNFDLIVAGRVLASTQGKESEEYILKLLDIGDGEKIGLAWINGKNSSIKVIEKISTVLKKSADEILQYNLMSLLEQAANPACKNSAIAVKALLSLFADPGKESLKYNIACALARSDCKNKEVFDYLRALLKEIEQNNPDDGRASYIKELLDKEPKK